MDISSVNSDLIRGNVTTIILGCLLNADKYGYEILKEIEDKSNSQYVLKQATLYNQLKRLEKQGLVSSYDGDPDDTGGGKRRYYTLTKEGRDYLTKERQEYEYSRTILDKLVSEKEFDFTVPIPFDASELRPYSRREQPETKIVYKDKIVEKIVEVEKPVERIVEIEKPVEKIIEVEKPITVEKERKIYLDRYGNEIDEANVQSLIEQAQLDDEELHKKDEELRLANEKLKENEAELLAHKDLLREKEELLAKTETKNEYTLEKLLSTEEQLRKSEEDREFVKNILKRMEYEKARADEAQRLREEEEKRLAEEERLLAQQEEERKREEQLKPSQTVEEMFAKLESQSEYDKVEPVRVQEFEQIQPEEHTYINAYTNQPEQSTRAQTTLKDIFRQLDEREAKIDEELAKTSAPEQSAEQEAPSPEYTAVAYSAPQDVVAESARTNDADVQHTVTSAVINRAENGFDYEKDNVNYREFFYSIADTSTDDRASKSAQQVQQPEYVDSDIKTRLYAKGFKIRPYDRGNTAEYYTFNFLQSNRINRDTFLIILSFFAVEIAIMWASLATRISYVYFLPILLVGSAFCLVPTVLYLLNPTKRKRANFNFKLSLLNRGMIYIELSIVCVLIGFFALGASINDMTLILESIILPIVLLSNIPLSSLIYWLLYRTHKYHIA